MTVEKATVAELDDEPGKVYAFGLDLDDVDEEVAQDLVETLDYKFEHAETILVGLPIEGSIEISEMDADEIQEIIDYNDVMGSLDG